MYFYLFSAPRRLCYIPLWLHWPGRASAYLTPYLANIGSIARLAEEERAREVDDEEEEEEEKEEEEEEEEEQKVELLRSGCWWWRESNCRSVRGDPETTPYRKDPPPFFAVMTAW